MVLEIDDHTRIPPARFECSLSISQGLQVAMANFMSYVAVPIAIGAVALVLLAGLMNMMMGGSGNTSQKLMRLRVLLQAVAIGVIMLTLWFMGK
jgi:Hypoxia induced protein conserved region